MGCVRERGHAAGHAVRWCADNLYDGSWAEYAQNPDSVIEKDLSR